MNKWLVFLILAAAFAGVHASVLDDCMAVFTPKHAGSFTDYYITSVVPIAGQLPEARWVICNGGESSGPLHRMIGCYVRVHSSDFQKDSDGDSINDGIEEVCSHLAVNGSQILSPTERDTDMDGLNDGEELALGTLPFARDSDGDGLSDGFEVKGDMEQCPFNTCYYLKPPYLDKAVRFRLDPLNPDTDGDGLSDGEEVRLCGAFLGANSLLKNDREVMKAVQRAPSSRDADGDGIIDSEEIYPPELGVNIKTNAVDPYFSGLSSTAVIGIFTKDTDWDGAEDGKELKTGTEVVNPDTDGDGLSDGEELELGTDPLSPDTDGDGLSDGFEVSEGEKLPVMTWLMKVPKDIVEKINGEKTDPLNPDTDGDGLSDWEELRFSVPVYRLSRADFEVKDKTAISKLYFESFIAYVFTDPLNPDTDGDGKIDSQDPFVWNFLDSDSDGLSDSVDPCPHVSDCDFDGLSDSLEREIGTDPTKPDTDGDYLIDGFEAAVARYEFGASVGKLNLLSVDTDGDGAIDGREVICGCEGVPLRGCLIPIKKNEKPEACDFKTLTEIYIDGKKVKEAKSDRGAELEVPRKSYEVKLKPLTSGIRVDGRRIFGKVKGGSDIKLSYADSFFTIWEGEKKTRCRLKDARVDGEDIELDRDKMELTIHVSNTQDYVNEFTLTLTFECNATFTGEFTVSQNFFVLVNPVVKPEIEEFGKWWNSGLNVGVLKVGCRNCDKLEVVASRAYVNGKSKAVFENLPGFFTGTFRIVPVKRFYTSVEGPGTLYFKGEEQIEFVKNAKDVGYLMAKATLAKSTFGKIAFGVAALSKAYRITAGGLELVIPKEEGAEEAKEVKDINEIEQNIKQSLIEKGIELAEEALVKAAESYEAKISKHESDFKVVVKACNSDLCTTKSFVLHGYEFE